MDISDFDEEDEHVIHIDEDLGSFSASTSIIELNFNTPSSSTPQPNQDLPTIPTPQTINVPPPPTLLLDYIVLREVCENIFEDLNKLVKARNDPVHTVNYEDKWIALREIVVRVFCDLQRLSIEARNQALNKWLKEFIKSMEAVEVRRNMMFISYSPFYLDISVIISKCVKEYLNPTLITKMLIKIEEPAPKARKVKDYEEDKRFEKL